MSDFVIAVKIWVSIFNVKMLKNINYCFGGFLCCGFIYGVVVQSYLEIRVLRSLDDIWHVVVGPNFVFINVFVWQGRTQGGLQPPSKTPQNRHLKNTDFVDMMVLKIFK
jgi:hypothetical protein